MTLMAGPIDTRVNPNQVNEFAASQPLEWFTHNLICTVPPRYAGAGRRVYPGFIQLGAFMSMNMSRHIKAHIELFEHLVRGESDKAQAAIAFYHQEYFAVLDLPAEFYLETVGTIFQQQALPLGKLEWRGQRVDPGAIRRTALLTVEGEKDDICVVGRPLPHRICARACAPTASAITCRPGSATTASSAASAGSIRSIRSCATSSSPAIEHF
jgi:polyhydroxyalkanoate depolymerase